MTGVLEHKSVNICSNRLQLTIASRDLFQAKIEMTDSLTFDNTQQIHETVLGEKVVILSKNTIFLGIVSPIETILF